VTPTPEVTTDPDRQLRPFADVLLELNAGQTHDAASMKLNELVQAVALYGKPGSLTVTIKVKQAGRNAGSTVIVSADVKAKVPEGEQADSVFFVGRDGNLTRNPPGQERLPLREVPGGIVVAGTGEVVPHVG
jgi:hypothetical protein